MAAKKNVTVRKPSALKRARQSIKLRGLNFSYRSELRTAVKKVRAAVVAGQADNAKSIFVSSMSTIDSIAAKGIVHKNKAARLKSRLSASIKAMSAKAA